METNKKTKKPRTPEGEDPGEGSPPHSAPARWAGGGAAGGFGVWGGS